MMTTKSLAKSAASAVVALLAAAAFSTNARAGIVDLGAAAQFSALALTHGIDDSGPLGPNGAYTIDGNVGIASSGQRLSASGSVRYSGEVFLHSGSTFNSSAPGVPSPQPQNAANDAFLERARSDAFAASNFASGLAATATYGSITNNLTISQANAGNYVFNINSINFSGGKALTLNAPAGSSLVLNVTGSIVLTSGSILVSGGLTAADVLINYTGTSEVRFSGGGNTSQIYATVLAPYAEVGLHPGFIAAGVIADKITMSSGGQIGITPVPEVSSFFPIIGLLVAVGGTHILRRRKLAIDR